MCVFMYVFLPAYTDSCMWAGMYPHIYNGVDISNAKYYTTNANVNTLWNKSPRVY